MKKILRLILVEFLGLYFANEIASGMVFSNAAEGLLITSVALGLAMFVIKPVINLLLLPLNLATMGLFKFLGHVITLYIVDVALPQFSVTGFHFAGFSSSVFDMPPINYDEGPVVYLLFSLVIWFLTTLIHWLRK